MALLSETDFRRLPGGLVLVGGRCEECAAVAFPRTGSCARCTSDRVREEILPTAGVLWTWTVQHFQPKEPYDGPAAFQPYGVGYVDLGDVLVEARLTITEGLRVGMPMTLVEDHYTEDFTTYAFAPSEVTA